MKRIRKELKKRRPLAVLEVDYFFILHCHKELLPVEIDGTPQRPSDPFEILW